MNKRLFLLLLLPLLLLQGIKAQDRLTTLPAGSFNFIVANDLGRNGYYEQRPIADRMGEMAGPLNIRFVVSPGDVHHFGGVASVNDPLWMTNYELIYSHPDLMCEWYPVMGNHEYRGNTQAVLDYAKVSRRWCMKDRYYTQVYDIGKGASLRIVYIDTTPLIDRYRSSNLFPDAGKQNMEKQLAWIDSTLSQGKATWTIVIGHHPIYAQATNVDEELADMQKRVDPILRKHKVNMYISGHIHNFQYIRKPDSEVTYIVNSSASQSRPVSYIDGTQFCSPEAGFSVISATDESLMIYLINAQGDVLGET